MNPATANPPSAPRTWREIPQEIAPRSMSREGKKRHWLSVLRTFLGFTCLLALAWGGFELWKTWRSSPSGFVPAAQSEPLREIVLRTDGVLDLARVEALLDLPPRIELMSLDLPALREALLAGGQVREALLARELPDKLVITLEERTPVLRVVVRGATGRPETLFVARDGAVYTGQGYDPALVASLPYLDGVRLVRDAAGYQPVRGMETVANLLGTALSGAPDLYREFQVVSLARLAADGEIVVRTARVESVIFGTREDFYRQLAKLDLILDEMRRPDGAAPIKVVNLAVGGRQVPVSFNDAPAAGVAAPVRQSPGRQLFQPLQPAPANRNRDF